MHAIVRRWIRSDMAILAGFITVAAIISCVRGQDNWWDVINYHIYNPWALLNHRWGKDLFAAGIQGYFDPLVDIPYYLVAVVWLPAYPRVVSALAGLPYGFLAFASFLIARRLLSGLDNIGRLERMVHTVLIVLLSVTGVSAWSQAGTTTNEVTTSTFVLFAMVAFLKLREKEQSGLGRARYSLITGALLGVAAGLKLTAAIFAPAMGLVLLATSRDLRTAFRDGLLYFFGWVLAFALIYGPWAWHLVGYTGNPFFPMFNDIFHSSFSAPAGGRELQYLPKTVGQWLFYPFYWLNTHKPTVYNHLSFRDGRVLCFYVVGLLYLVAVVARRLRGRPPLASRSVHAVALFCALSYIIWLVMFSMLRYGMVIEVLSSIVAPVLVLSVLASLRLNHLAIWRVLGVAAIVTLLMGSTVYPDVPRIDYSRHVYDAHVPDLPKGSLVILANQPMGLLAPLIARRVEDVTFVGIPLCFAQHGWCYRGFYQYGLGKDMRARISGHAGPIYVAYYMNRSPALPQLASFRLQIARDACSIMTTNTTARVALCKAHYVPVGESYVQVRQKVKLALDIKYLVPGAHLNVHWKVNHCRLTSAHGQFTVEWHMPVSDGRVRVYIQAPPSPTRSLFSSGRAHGVATTGVWVKAEQRFDFIGSGGKLLARATSRYVPCSAR